MNSDDQHEIPMKLHEGVGVGAGAVDRTPVVTLTFMKDEFVEDLTRELNEEGKYEPDDGRWHNIAMTVRGARQLIEDLKEGIDQAIAGPPR